MPTGVDLLNKAKELGKNSEYADTRRNKNARGLGEDLNSNGIPEYDCSGLITKALWELGYTNVQRLSSQNISKLNEYFYEVSPENAQAGDIIVFRTGPGQGHVGIVEWYDPSTGVGKFYGRQTSGAYSAFFGKKGYWGKYPFKIYRFKGFDQNQKQSSVWDFFKNFFVPSAYAEETRNKVREGSRRIDPLVIDLDGDGIKLVNINKSNAMFDLTGSGFANKVGWVSPDDGFLVWDRNGNGRVDDITEMFGNATQSGFQALSLYDTNRDGKIDAFDDVFKNLKVWQDRDADGRTDEGELMTLDEAGIKTINLNTQKTNINQGGNEITEVGTVEHTDGTKIQAGNVNFELDRLYSYYNREVKLNPEIVGLPWVRGYGFMPDLPIAKLLEFRYNFAQRRVWE